MTEFKSKQSKLIKAKLEQVRAKVKNIYAQPKGLNSYQKISWALEMYGLVCSRGLGEWNRSYWLTEADKYLTQWRRSKVICLVLRTKENYERRLRNLPEMPPFGPPLA